MPKLFNNLRFFNLLMGFLHLIQGLIMWFLSKEQKIQSYLYIPDPQKTFSPIIDNPEKFIEINLGQTIAFFLFFSAIAHFITVMPKIYQWYLDNLKKEINLIRWWEYAFSSSLMVVVIAMLCRIYDANTLFLLFSINACMNLFGLMMEKHNSVLKVINKLKNKEEFNDTNNIYQNSFQTDWSSFLYGVFAGIVPWIVMGIYFFTIINKSSETNPIPSFVYWIFPTLFIFFNLFAINMFLQYKKFGNWKNYLFGEKMYIFLSLSAKSVLAWIIWGGTLR